MTKTRMFAFLAWAIALATALVLVRPGVAAEDLTPLEELGSFLYFDTNLSKPRGQACASCHEPDFGFVDPDSDLPVSEGIIPMRFGNRNSPSAAYAMYAPMFHFDEVEGLWFGGQFWDGRATGEVLGDPLADQALGPFLNLVEMNNNHKHQVVNQVKRSDYADLFRQVWGPDSLDDIVAAYDQIALSIAAFERTALFAQFNSKYDAYLIACIDVGGDPADCGVGAGPEAAVARLGILDDQEWDGLQLFMGEVNDNDGVLEPGEGAMCVLCHVGDFTAPGPTDHVPGWAPSGLVPPIFTDFSFDNLGVPKNPDNPFYDLQPRFNPDGENFVDLGLGVTLQNAGYEADIYEAEMGKVKVMGLRNIGITGPYMHNGVFETLEEVVHFYNTRDSDSVSWPPPEVPDNVNTDELGNLGLSTAQEEAVAAFMRTLTDGYGD